MAFSPADDLLATTHVASLGVHLWDNRATYQRLHLKPLPLDYSPPLDEGPNSEGLVNLPTRGLQSKKDIGDGDIEEMDVDLDEDDEESENEERSEKDNATAR